LRRQPPAGCVGGQDRRGAIGKQQVWMMSLRLGDAGDPVDELDSRHEAFELDRSGEAQAALGLLDAPVRDLGQQPVDLVAWEWRSAGLTHHAMALGKWCRHQGIVRAWVELGVPWGG